MKKKMLSALTIEYHLPMSSDLYASGDEIIMTMETYASNLFNALQDTIACSDELDGFESTGLQEVIADFADSLNIMRFVRDQMRRESK